MNSDSFERRQRIVVFLKRCKSNLTQLAMARFAYSKMIQKPAYRRGDIVANTAHPLKVRRTMRLTDEQRARLDELVGADPHLTLEQLRAELQVNCSLSVIWDELQLLTCTHNRKLRDNRGGGAQIDQALIPRC